MNRIKWTQSFSKHRIIYNMQSKFLKRSCMKYARRPTYIHCVDPVKHLKNIYAKNIYTLKATHKCRSSLRLWLICLSVCKSHECNDKEKWWKTKIYLLMHACTIIEFIGLWRLTGWLHRPEYFMQKIGAFCSAFVPRH